MRRQLTASAKAWVAAARHGMPAKSLPVIAFYGRDGSATAVAFLAQMLRHAGQRVGIITPEYVEIAGEHVKGSDQAHPFDDPFRLQQLLAQMKRAGCGFVLLALPASVPAHQFQSLPFSVFVVRRVADEHLDQVSAAAASAQAQLLLRRVPGYIVLPRDDTTFKELHRFARPDASLSYGTDEKAESRISRVRIHPKGAEVRLVIDHQTTLNLATRLTGKQVIFSLAAAASAAYVLHVPLESIEGGATKLAPQPTTCEFLPIDRPYHVVLDSSVTPQGVAEVLETLKHFAKNRLIAVVSASLGQLPNWRSVVGEVVAERADRVIVTDGDYRASESPQAVRAQLLEGISRAGREATTEEIPDRQAAIEKALALARRGDIIVFCAVTTRPYRQIGADHLPWNDKTNIQALL